MFSELSGSGETCFKLWCHYIIMELCADYFLLNCYEEIKKCQEIATFYFKKVARKAANKASTVASERNSEQQSKERLKCRIKIRYL